MWISPSVVAIHFLDGLGEAQMGDLVATSTRPIYNISHVFTHGLTAARASLHEHQLHVVSCTRDNCKMRDTA